MIYNLPPLNSLKAFEAAARHLSFTKAAKELCVTQGAISKQVKILEEFLGFSLFQRMHQQLILTNKALKYYQEIHLILHKINDATSNIISDKASTSLKLDILPSISSLLIAPNIDSFKQEFNHDIQINIKANDKEINLNDNDTDIFIRCRKNEVPGFVNHKLLTEKMLLISSPQIAKNINNIQDISNYNIIEHSERAHILQDWAHNSALDFNNLNKITFEHFFMIIEAVRNNVGIAFIPSFLAAKMIANKEIVNLLDTNYVSQYNYYLLYKEHKHNAQIESFSNWLKKQI